MGPGGVWELKEGGCRRREESLTFSSTADCTTCAPPWIQNSSKNDALKVIAKKADLAVLIVLKMSCAWRSRCMRVPRKGAFKKGRRHASAMRQPAACGATQRSCKCHL